MILSLPGGLVPKSATWSLEHNVAVQASPLGNTIQRLHRDGGRWRADVTFPTFDQSKGPLFAAYLDRASRGDAWTYITPPHNDARGNWGPDELVANGDFVNGTVGWLPGNGAALNENARRLRVKVGGSPGAVATAVQSGLATEADQPHVFMVDLHKGSTANWRIKLYPSGSPSQDEHFSYYEDEGRVIFTHIPETSSTTLELACNSTSEQDYVYFANVSAARCLLVNDSLAVGNECDVKGGPASNNGAIKAGEFVTIQLWNGWQMVRLTEDLDTDSSGNGTLRFEPALRDGVKGGGAVIVHKPFCRMFVPAHASPHAIDMPRLHGFSVSYVEDVTEIGITENPQDTDLIWYWDAHSYSVAPSVGSGTPTLANSGKTYFDQSGVLKTTELDPDATGSPTSYTPAFDHDAETGALRGLLIEAAATNEVLWARDFSRSSWAKTNMTAALDEVGEDGEEDSCSSLLATANNATVTQTIASASNTNRVWSVSVKRLIGGGTIELSLDNGSNWLNVTEQVGADDFTRVSHTATLANPTVCIRLGTSGDKIAVDYAQEATGALPTSRIVTGGASAGRSNDVSTLALANTLEFSSTQGTAVVEAVSASMVHPTNNQYVLSLNDSTSSEVIAVRRRSADGLAAGLVIDGGVELANPTAAAWANSAAGRACIGWATNDVAFSFLGAAVSVDNAVTIPAVTQLEIGALASGQHAQSPIRRVSIFKTKKPNRQIRSLSA